MSKPSDNSNKGTGAPKHSDTPRKLDLPFDRKREEAGEWVYEHRVPIFVTVIVYLSLAIAFVTGKIVFDNKLDPEPEMMVVDIAQLEQLQAQLHEAQELNRRLSGESGGGSVRNVASNEDAGYGDGKGSSTRLTEGAHLRDDRGTNVEDIYEYASQVEASMRSGREQYQRGLAEQQALLGEQGGGNESSNSSSIGASEHASRVQQGEVTVSYSFSKPLRTHYNLVVPSYQCRGGGQVVVKVTVNPNGDVTDAVVDTSRSVSDHCMTGAAVRAARQSRFNVDTSAPAKQPGTIIYVFVPQ